MFSHTRLLLLLLALLCCQRVNIWFVVKGQSISWIARLHFTDRRTDYVLRRRRGGLLSRKHSQPEAQNNSRSKTGTRTLWTCSLKNVNNIAALIPSAFDIFSLKLVLTSLQNIALFLYLSLILILKKSIFP